jgi:hypothetical protein
MNKQQQYGFDEFHRGYTGGKRHTARTILAAHGEEAEEENQTRAWYFITARQSGG